MNIFTFHYGSILIGRPDAYVYTNVIFTFHYGSILIALVVYGLDTVPNLHSTMVLF